MQNTFNKVLKACIASVLGCGILASSVFGAEKEGKFVGVELGANQAKFQQDIDVSMMGRTVAGGDIKAKNFLPSVAIKGGYKWFFGREKNFGVRAYGQVGVGYGSMKSIEYSSGLSGLETMISNATNSIFTGTGKTYWTTFIDYFVGADLLYNFVSTQEMIFGVYGGLGLGGVTWIANGKEYEVSNGSRSYVNFSANANVGLRANIKEQHGIELGARFYFPKSEIFTASNGKSPLMSGPMMQMMMVSETTTTHTRPFSIILSYNYNF